MWLLTSFGAFMPALRPPETVAEGDDQVLQIRARRAVDLRRLRDYYMPDLGRTYSIPNSDYQFRANCTRADLAAALVRISLDIDYVSFKDTTETVWGDGELHQAYMRVWQVLATYLAPPRRKRRARRSSHRLNWWEDAALLREQCSPDPM